MAPARYALLPPREEARLDAGRERFLKVLDEELLRLGEDIPEDARAMWVISRDFGRLVDLWKASMRKSEGPVLAHDILALHGHICAEPRIYSRDVVRDLMDPEEAYALPVSDCQGRHLATIIHVGPDAREGDIRRLTRSLIKDPSGRDASLEGAI